MMNKFSRKKRQLSAQAEELHRLIMNSQGQTTPAIHKLINRINRLLTELKHHLSLVDLRKALGATALFFGLVAAQPTQAQHFLAPVNNPFNFQNTGYVTFPATADLDGDGDVDVLLGEYYGSMRYYENVGTSTNPQFAAPVVNPFGLDSVYEFALPEFADMDNDGDLDLMVAEYYGSIQYFENTGTSTAPSFASPVTNPFSFQQGSNTGLISLADLDNDGDTDMIVGEYYGTLSYFQNVGTASVANFALPTTNPFGLSGSSLFTFPDFGDLDNDGDIDLMASNSSLNLVFFENTGTAQAPNFAAGQVNPFNLDSAASNVILEMADFDDDGDLDILTTDYYGNFLYYENAIPSGVEEQTEQLAVEVFPNPSNGVIQFTTKEVIALLEVMDLTGRTVLKIQNPQRTINLSEYPAGAYLIQFTNASGETQTQKVVKR